MTKTPTKDLVWEIQGAIALRYGYTRSDLLGRRRTFGLAYARQMAIAVARHCCKVKDRQIANLFERHRSTIPYSASSILDLGKVYPDIDKEFKKWVNKFKQ